MQAHLDGLLCKPCRSECDDCVQWIKPNCTKRKQGLIRVKYTPFYAQKPLKLILFEYIWYLLSSNDYQAEQAELQSRKPSCLRSLYICRARIITVWRIPNMNKALYQLMSSLCLLDRALNDKFSVECLFWFFQPTWKSELKVVQITKNDLFWVNAPL